MGEEVERVRHQELVVTLLIYTIFMITAFELLSWWLERLMNKGGPTDPIVIQMHAEIVQLEQELSSFLEIDTFVHTWALLIVRKDELANYIASHREMRQSYDFYLKVLHYFEVLAFVVFFCWYWRVPVATISQRLVQPFGKLLSWRTGDPLNNYVWVKSLSTCFLLLLFLILYQRNRL